MYEKVTLHKGLWSGTLT